MRKPMYLFIKVRVRYFIGSKVHHWDYYGKLFASGTLKVFNPNYKIEECTRRNYFTGKVYGIHTNKHNVIMYDNYIAFAFYDVFKKGGFAGFNYEQICDEAYKDHVGTTFDSVAVKVDGRYHEITRVKVAEDQSFLRVECSDGVTFEQYPDGSVLLQQKEPDDAPVNSEI